MNEDKGDVDMKLLQVKNIEMTLLRVKDLVYDMCEEADTTLDGVEDKTSQYDVLSILEKELVILSAYRLRLQEMIADFKETKYV